MQPDVRRLPHDSFADRWVAQLQRLGHEPVLVDVFASGVIDRLRKCDGFLWWFTPTRFPRELGKRLMQALDHAGGLPMFPDARAVWHFDDKVAQAYLLQAAGIPAPRTWVFWEREAAANFFRTAEYPLVLKLAAGNNARNVALLRNARDADRWSAKLFGRGVASLRQRLPFLRRWPDVQQGYVLVQEFVAGNPYDTRVAVIGDRAVAYRRFNRPNDFRASGSGNLDRNPAAVEGDVVQLAFDAARRLGAASLCVDVLRRDGQPVISEMSYYYEGYKLEACPGYWTSSGEWRDRPLDPAEAILDDFLAVLSGAPGSQPGDFLREVRPPAARTR